MFNPLVARLSTGAGLGRAPAVLGFATLDLGRPGGPRGPPAGAEGFSISRRYLGDPDPTKLGFCSQSEVDGVVGQRSRDGFRNCPAWRKGR